MLITGLSSILPWWCTLTEGWCTGCSANDAERSQKAAPLKLSGEAAGAAAATGASAGERGG